MKAVLPITLLVSTAVIALAEAPVPSTPLQESSRVTAVALTVHVYDAGGAHLAGLGRDDFAVREDGRAVAVVDVHEVGPARTDETPEMSMPADDLLLVFDLLNTDPESLSRAKGIAVELLDHLAPDSRAAIFTLGHLTGLSIRSVLDADHARAIQAIDAIRPDAMGSAATAQPTDESDVRLGAVQDTLQISRFTEALRRFAEMLRVADGRKTVLLFSNGLAVASSATADHDAFEQAGIMALDPVRRSIDSRTMDSLRQAVRGFASADCRLFIADTSVGGGQGFSGRTLLDDVALKSGGASLHGHISADRLSAVVQDGPRYLIIYESPADSDYHRVTVTVADERARHVKYRDGYYAHRQGEETEQSLRVASALYGMATPSDLLLAVTAFALPDEARGWVLTTVIDSKGGEPIDADVFVSRDDKTIAHHLVVAGTGTLVAEADRVLPGRYSVRVVGRGKTSGWFGVADAPGAVMVGDGPAMTTGICLLDAVDRPVAQPGATGVRALIRVQGVDNHEKLGVNLSFRQQDGTVQLIRDPRLLETRRIGQHTYDLLFEVPEAAGARAMFAVVHDRATGERGGATYTWETES